MAEELGRLKEEALTEKQQSFRCGVLPMKFSITTSFLRSYLLLDNVVP